jgi:CARDB protein
VRVSNLGAGSGPERVELMGSSAADDSSVPQVLAESAPFSLARKTVRFRLTSANAPMEGPLFLIAQVASDDSRGGGGDLKVVAPHATQFVAPSVDLTAAIVQQPIGPVFVGSRKPARASASVLVLNSGSTSAVGTLTATIYASRAATFDANAVAIGSVVVRRITISAGRSRPVLIPITLSAGTPAGSYQLFVVINASNDIIETNTTNNIATSQSPLVVTNTIPPKPSHHHDDFDDGSIVYDDGSDYVDDSSDTTDWPTTQPDNPSPDDSTDTTTSPDTPTTEPTTQPTTQPTGDNSDDSSTGDDGGDDSWW